MHLDACAPRRYRGLTPSDMLPPTLPAEPANAARRPVSPPACVRRGPLHSALGTAHLRMYACAGTASMRLTVAINPTASMHHRPAPCAPFVVLQEGSGVRPRGRLPLPGGPGPSVRVPQCNEQLQDLQCERCHSAASGCAGLPCASILVLPQLCPALAPFSHWRAWDGQLPAACVLVQAALLPLGVHLLTCLPPPTFCLLTERLRLARGAVLGRERLRVSAGQTRLRHPRPQEGKVPGTEGACSALVCQSCIARQMHALPFFSSPPAYRARV